MVRACMDGHVPQDGNGASITWSYHFSAAFILYSLHNVKCQYIATSCGRLGILSVGKLRVALPFLLRPT